MAYVSRTGRSHKVTSCEAAWEALCRGILLRNAAPGPAAKRFAGHLGFQKIPRCWLADYPLPPLSGCQKLSPMSLTCASIATFVDIVACARRGIFVAIEKSSRMFLYLMRASYIVYKSHAACLTPRAAIVSLRRATGVAPLTYSALVLLKY